MINDYEKPEYEKIEVSEDIILTASGGLLGSLFGLGSAFRSGGLNSNDENGNPRSGVSER